jgi:hypothetical protein
VLFPKPPWLYNRKKPVLALLENLPTTVTFVKVFCAAQISETCFWMRSEIMEFFLTAICLSILLTPWNNILWLQGISVKLEIKKIPLWRAKVTWGVVEGSVAGTILPMKTSIMF